MVAPQEPLVSPPYLFLLLLLLVVPPESLARRQQNQMIPKPSPPNWDKEACARREAVHGPGAACRGCTDAELGFGKDFQLKVAGELERHESVAMTSAATETGHVWLRVAIATVPRAQHMPYLERVLLNLAMGLKHTYHQLWCRGGKLLDEGACRYHDSLPRIKQRVHADFFLCQ